MKIYDRCPDEVKERAGALIQKYHSDLKAAEVTIDYLFVSNDGDSEEPALKLHGYACYAVVKIVGLKERVKGCADAEIVIDRDKWDGLSAERKDALLDHELYHLEVKRNEEDGSFKVDSHYRPQLSMKLHDRQFGWFDAIARRHGAASIEVSQARSLVEESGQTYFSFLHDDEAGAPAAGGDSIHAAVGKFMDTLRAEGVTVHFNANV